MQQAYEGSASVAALGSPQVRPGWAVPVVPWRVFAVGGLAPSRVGWRADQRPRGFSWGCLREESVVHVLLGYLEVNNVEFSQTIPGKVTMKIRMQTRIAGGQCCSNAITHLSCCVMSMSACWDDWGCTVERKM